MNIQITHFKSQSFLHYFKQRNQTLIFEFERFPLLFDFSASLNFLKFDVTSKVWPFESESFDFVFSCLVLEHLPGVNYNNIVRAAFTPVGPKNVKNQSSCQYLFGLLVCAQAHKMSVKLTPGVNLTNIL